MADELAKRGDCPKPEYIGDPSFWEHHKCAENTVLFVLALLEELDRLTEGAGVLSWDKVRKILNKYADELNANIKEIVCIETDGECCNYEGWFPRADSSLKDNLSDWDARILEQIVNSLGM